MKQTSKLSLVLLLTACAGQPAAEHSWAPIEAAELSPAQARQAEQAVAAKEEMMKTLFAALTVELSTNGPAAAISVCKERAPEIAAEVGASQGVAIGRTSFKLRNPANTAPAWAAPLLTDRPEEARFSASDDGALGMTLPIRLQAKCLGCHGEREALLPEIRSALDELYPEDRATGFADGDLRGWFWVEVPASRDRE
jgi:hypothetical protein